MSEAESVLSKTRGLKKALNTQRKTIVENENAKWCEQFQKSVRYLLLPKNNMMLDLNEIEPPKIAEIGVCWFCKQNAPLSDTMYVPLNFLTERNVEEYGSMREIETRWLSKIVEVPRCGFCFEIHERYRKAYIYTKFVLTAVFVIGMGLFTWNAYTVSGIGAAIFVLAISVFLFYAFLKIVGMYLYILIKMIASSMGYNTDRRSHQFPLIAEHLRQGWKIGDDPDVTPEESSM